MLTPTLSVRKTKIINKAPHIISDGFFVSPTASIQIDASKMTDYEYFYVQRALMKGAIKVVQHEVVSESD